jgi:hypothetical protein
MARQGRALQARHGAAGLGGARQVRLDMARQGGVRQRAARQASTW